MLKMLLAKPQLVWQFTRFCWQRGLTQSPSRDCGQQQTMNNIVDMSLLTKFEGGLNLLHKEDDAGIYSNCGTHKIIISQAATDPKTKPVHISPP